MLDDFVAQEDRRVEILGQGLDAAGHVDRVADDRDLALAGMTHASEDHGTKMNANADAQGHIERALELGTLTLCCVLHEQRGPHGVPAGGLRRLLPNAESGENGVADVFVHEAVVVQHGFRDRREMLVQHMPDVVGQVLLREVREIPDVREKNGGLNLSPFAGTLALQLVEIENDDVLGVIDEEPDDDIPMDFHLAAQPRVVVPAPLPGHFLLPRVEGRNMGRAVKDLYPAGGAARLPAALMMVGYAATNGDAEQRLPVGDVLDGDAAVCINDLVHRPLPAPEAAANAFMRIK
jgi:hypothetical protein